MHFFKQIPSLRKKYEEKKAKPRTLPHYTMINLTSLLFRCKLHALCSLGGEVRSHIGDQLLFVISDRAVTMDLFDA